jgi:hypothetical protein
MSVKVVSQSDQSLTIQITFRLGGTMLQVEEGIQEALNEAGLVATEQKLRSFDTDGSPLIFGAVKLTSKGQFVQDYETPFGSVGVYRHVYQGNQGGKTYCPLEDRARLVLNATPRYAKMISFKYAELGAEKVAADMLETARRAISVRYVKMLGDAVGMMALAKEESWEYSLPELEDEVASVGVGVDGAYMLMKDDGWREAMAGSISLYNSAGERLHTICVGATPEYGKEKFRERFLRELNRVKSACGDIPYVGLGDGAKDNWTFLTQHTDEQVLDFFHASEYVSNVASVLFKGKGKDAERKSWLQERLHTLKHEKGGSEKLRKEMEQYRSDKTRKPRLTKDDRETITASITYFTNQKSRMEYWRYRESGYPIGSGVTEATCKTLIKSRFCGSGARWKDKGASFVLSIRSLRLTSRRWQQFWEKIDSLGCPGIDMTAIV